MDILCTTTTGVGRGALPRGANRALPGPVSGRPAGVTRPAVVTFEE